jgi:hypothetical protein
MTFPKSNGWTDQIDFKTKLVRNWAHVVNAAVSAEQIEISKYERYFNNRLIGITGSNEVLDGLPLLSAFRICELVGVMELKGDEVSPRSLKSDEHYEALTLGYETLADGYMGLRAFLQKRDQMFQTHRKKGFGFGLYGPLYRHLNRFRDEPEYAEITAFVSKHLFEHHPTSPETLYLGHAGGSGTLIKHSLRRDPAWY